MEINNISHKDSIWTLNKDKASLWLPYLSAITKSKGSKWLFEYNGGEVLAELNKVDFVLFYGASCAIPLSLFDDFRKHGIIAILHRRNIALPYVFHCSSLLSTKDDILTKQILTRENKTRCNYLSKCLVRERLKSLEWLTPIPASHYIKLRAEKRPQHIMAMEATHTKSYWDAYRRELNLPDNWTRRSKDDVTEALDACSYFLVGVILRWVLFHRLSPSHAFLHTSSDYISLVYDLIEPYRYLIEKSVARAIVKNEDGDWIARSMTELKDLLDGWCYVPTQKAYVKRKGLLHGVVLALRAYLQGDSRMFVIPLEGDKKGGRPVNSGYWIPGQKGSLDKKFARKAKR